MDTDFAISLAVLLGSAALLTLLAAAEASAIYLTRRRVTRDDNTGLRSLLRDYVALRQRTTRALRMGVTITTVAITLSAIAIVEGVLTVNEVIAALAVVGGVGTLRTLGRWVARSRPEATARTLDGPSQVLQLMLTPLSILVSLPVVIPVRALAGRTPGDEIDPAEELIGLLEATDEEDHAMLEERRMMRAVLELSNRTARELMTPRTDVTAFTVQATFAEAMKIVASTGYSRIPRRSPRR